MLRLAGPVVLAELGWMTMGVVDTMMVGRLGAEAISAVSVGNALFHALSIAGLGLLLGLDTVVSQAFGAGDIEDCHHSLLQAVYITLVLAPLLMAVVFLSIPWLRGWGLHPDIVDGSIAYARIAAWSTFPLLLFTALRRYLQGMGLVRAIMVVLVSANLVNVLANWLLVFGNAGFPALGVEGAAWATFWSRLYMCAALLVYVAYREHPNPAGFRAVSWRPDLERISRLVRLGLPAAAQIGLEVGVFAAATTLAGTLNPAASAAHQIALNSAALAFMVPLGVSAAGAVRVGQALGRRDPQGAHRSGWTALFLGAGFMLCTGLLVLVAPGGILRVYTNDPAVMSRGFSLLFVAAAFQLFDGVQVVATGVLRGAGDTRTPMITALVCYWLLGLPVGYYLCFQLGWGVQGLWIGLCLGLITVGVILLFVWSRMAMWPLQESYAGD
jgi:MATE family multidrug resistance protein